MFSFIVKSNSRVKLVTPCRRAGVWTSLPSVYCREGVSNYGLDVWGERVNVIVSKASKDSVHSSAILLPGSCSRLSAWALKVSELARMKAFSLYIRYRYILCLPCCAQPICWLWLASSGKVFWGQGCHPSPCCFQIPSLRECLLSLFLTSYPLRELSQGQDGQMSCLSPRLSPVKSHSFVHDA